MFYKKEWWAQYCLDILPTGSRVICDPPPMDTDEDYLCLVDTGVVNKFIEDLTDHGFIIGGSLSSKVIRYKAVWNGTGVEYTKIKVENANLNLKEFPSEEDVKENRGLFLSFKKDSLNLILTCSPEYFDNFLKATVLAKSMNLLEKKDRVMLFEAITRNVWP
jgi:hypothetical protein